MKILITSDIHGNERNLNKIISKHQDSDFHLDAGDSNLSTSLLDNLNILSVKGNTDFFHKLPKERILEIDNKKILLIHGHTLRIKWNFNNLHYYAQQLNVDICIYGHTHRQLLEEVNGITYLNPGSVLDNKYAVYKDGKISLF